MAAVEATPQKPNMPAISATSRNTQVYQSICYFSPLLSNMQLDCQAYLPELRHSGHVKCTLSGSLRVIGSVNARDQREAG